MNVTTFEKLEEEYWAHLNGWELPRDTTFYCLTCKRNHKGVIARRYGQDIVYKDTGNGVLAQATYHNGAYYCI